MGIFPLLGSRGGVGGLVGLSWGRGGGVHVSFLGGQSWFFVKECRSRMNTVLTSVTIKKSAIALRRAVCFLCQSPLLDTLLTPFTCPRPDRLYSAAILNRNNRIPCLHLSQVQRLGLLSPSLLLAYGNQILYTLQRIPVSGAMNLCPGLQQLER